MLSETALAAYRSDGFVVLPDILTSSEVNALRRVTDDFVEVARSVAANDAIYDLGLALGSRAAGAPDQDAAFASP